MGERGGRVIAHSFAEQDAFSKRAEDEAFWLAAYKAFFPDFLTMSPCVPNVDAQRMGVDRVIVLTNGREVRIDEKKRAQTYTGADGKPDILLEFLSNDRIGAPGWIAKPLLIDFIAYGLLDTKMVYMLPWDGLRRVWRGNGDGWKQRYGVKKAVNNGYSTHSVAVPVSELYRAISAACQVTVVQLVDKGN